MSPSDTEQIIEWLKKVEEEVSDVRESLERGYPVYGEALCHPSIVLENAYLIMAAPKEKKA